MPTTAMPTPAGRVARAVQTDQSGSQPIELDCGEGWVIAEEVFSCGKAGEYNFDS